MEKTQGTSVKIYAAIISSFYSYHKETCIAKFGSNNTVELKYYY